MGGRGEDGSGGAGAGVGEGEGEALVFGVDSSGGAEPAATARPRRALGLRNPGIWGRGWARGPRQKKGSGGLTTFFGGGGAQVQPADQPYEAVDLTTLRRLYPGEIQASS